MEDSLIYRSYLLRLWQVREEADLAWQASLEEVSTGEKHGFTSLEELIAFLRLYTESTQNDAEVQIEF